MPRVGVHPGPRRLSEGWRLALTTALTLFVVSFGGAALRLCADTGDDCAPSMRLVGLVAGAWALNLAAEVVACLRAPRGAGCPLLRPLRCATPTAESRAVARPQYTVEERGAML